MFSRRRAQDAHTPTDWGAFCKQALDDASCAYRAQLVREGTLDDLDVLIADLNARLSRNVHEYTEINEQLTEALKQREQRRASHV